MMVLHIILLVAVALKTVSSSCSGSTNELTAEYDVVTKLFSDNYPYQYPNSQDCSWRITAANGSQNILLHIDNFYLETSYDYLYIYDGNSSSSPLIWQQSGSHRDVFFISSSENLYLRFRSDYSISYTGFSIQYMAVDRNSSAVSYSCDDTLTASTSLKQFSVIDDYDLTHSSLCSYTITSSVGTKLMFSVPIIQDYSALAVYDGTSSSASMIVTYTGFSDHENWYLSTSNSIYVVKPSGSNFLMVYQEVDIAATVQSAAVTTPTPAVEYACSSGTLDVTSTPAHIESPNYPSPYPNNAYCTRTFIATDLSKSVQITFLDFDLSYCCDYVEIFDGYDTTYPSLGIGWYRGMNVTSTGAALHGVFVTDGTGALSGFLIEYVQVDRALPDCVPGNATYVTASTSEQSIFSPNYPSNYDNNLDTYWLITKSSEAESLILDIREMQIESSRNCYYDNITIYDGACTTSPILEVLCGTNTAIIEHTSGLYILIQFTTDSSVTETGFELVYYMGSKSAEEESFWWGFIPIVVAGVVVLIIIISCIAYGRYRRLRATRQQVAPGTTATSNGLVNPPQPQNVKYKRPLTTSELLLQLQGRYGSKENDKKPKPKRKHTDMYSAQPGFSGQTNMGYQQSEHPPPYYPPPYGGGSGDPAYPPPPSFFMVSANEAMNAPNPAMATGSEPPPFTPQPVTEGTSSIPAASTYMTPSEARQAKALK